MLLRFCYALLLLGCSERAATPELDASLPLDASRRDVERAQEAPQDAGHPDPLLVVTTKGALRGKLEGATREFFGIPYAKPPVGALRLAPPEPSEPWPGERDATAFASDCVHPPLTGIPSRGLPQAEDCLYLNVWTPREAATGVPVLVHALSGAFRYGGSADIDGRMLSEAAHAIVVVPNFRQGPLGYFLHPSLDGAHPSGNQGLRDQQSVLRWVHDNIAAFGGDPARVTLYGQSAGAQSSCLHWFAPESRALVQRYFMQSGSCVQYLNVPLDRKRVAKVSQDLVDDLCAGERDVPACLRALPVEAIALWGAGELRPIGEDFYPQIDGDVLPWPPLEAFARGEHSDAPILLGTVPHEWAVVLLYGGKEVPHPTSLLELWFYFSVFFGEGTGDVIAQYAPLGTPDGEADAVLERVMSDMMFHCPARSFARRASAAGGAVYLYSFELPPAVHGLDIDYLFDVPWISPAMKPPLYEVAAPVPLNRALVNALQSYAAHFLETGDPGGDWPRYQDDRHQVLASSLTTGRDLYADTCDFWDRWHERWDP